MRFLKFNGFPDTLVEIINLDFPMYTIKSIQTVCRGEVEPKTFYSKLFKDSEHNLDDVKYN